MIQYMSIVSKLASAESAASFDKRDSFAPFKSYLDDMRREGAVVVIQLDGSPAANAKGAYSVIATGGQLASEHVSVDADTLSVALLHAIDVYARKGWLFDDALALDLLKTLTAPIADPHDDVDICLPYLEKMKSEGASVLLKLDGQRGHGDNGPFTAAVRGGLLKDDFIRIDADSLAEAAAYIVVEYDRRCWRFSPG